MRQIVNIKRVQVDSELKVTVTLEFMATSHEEKENVFRLIEMQGDVVEASLMPSQQELPMRKEFEDEPVRVL